MNIREYVRIFCGIICALLLAIESRASDGSINMEMLQELKRMIELQQAQIDKQAAEITSLKEQLAGTSKAIAAKADQEATQKGDSLVTSSYPNVNLSLYGQVNPALLFVDSGESPDLYVVDNQHSKSRIGLRAGMDTASGWTVGGRIEIGISGNGSFTVNQLNTRGSNDEVFKLRWAEVSFLSDRIGTFSLGQGSSASDTTAEVDLSGTGVAMLDKTLWMAGATLLFDNNINRLTDTESKELFNGFDGLSRTERIRYDTPDFNGFSLAGAVSSGEAYDAGLYYSRKFGGTKVAAAFGAANPGDVISDADRLYTGSASILLPMGLNATFSLGIKDLTDQGRDDASLWWGKLGYLTNFHALATTAFSIDYGVANNHRANDEEATTWGFAAVHHVSDWGTEFYAIYRLYRYESDAADYEDVNSIMAGARLKF
jgi:predicted porin